jgi:hypothetical protein
MSYEDLYKKYLNKEINGKEFNEIFKDKFFCKIMEEDDLNNNKNITFSLIYNFYLFTDFDKKNNLFVVDIPNDAKITIDKYNFKTDKIILSKPTKIAENFSYLDIIKKISIDKKINFILNDFILNSVKIEPGLIKYLPDEYKTYDICLEAVSNYGAYLEYVPDIHRNEKMYLNAVKSQGNSIVFIKEKDITLELCKYAIKNSGLSLEFFPNRCKTFELCLDAVKENGYSIKYVPEKHKTFELCMMAFSSSKLISQYIPEEYHIKISASNII